jgi:hypothetical protein
MEKITFRIKRIVQSKSLLIVLMMYLLLSGSCTKQFEEINTPPLGITEEMLKADYFYYGAHFPQIQQSIYHNENNSSWEYQLQQNLIGDVYSGYLMPPTPFRGNDNNMTYALVDGWNGFPFSLAYQKVMAPALAVKKKTFDNNEALDFYAVSLILKVAGMHRVTDIYGPIPYTQYGLTEGGTPYDSQEAAYNAFFADLDYAIDELTDFVTEFPDAKPFIKFDQIFQGDYVQWIKFANTLRLRLALRIVYANENKAKTEGEKAMSNSFGLLGVGENASVSTDGLRHPLYTICNEWHDVRMGAPMESILTGLNDPRMQIYFSPSEIVPDVYKGIRNGSNIPSKDAYTPFSKISGSYISQSAPLQLMSGAESYFLRAEAKLRGWSVTGSVKDFYENGIKASFTMLGAPDVETYISDNTHQPVPYVDPVDAANNVPAGNPHLSTVTVQWDESASVETKLEKIITQKWIAGFPEGQEAWSEFRRTGYPKLFTVTVNNSGGKISTEGFIRRINFPADEYISNATEVQKAVTLLGGPDNGGTKLWWDKK